MDTDFNPITSAAEQFTNASSDGVKDSNGGAKKPAWNKPLDDVAELTQVMGAAAWPALSEITKASPKSSSDLLKNLSEGSQMQVTNSGVDGGGSSMASFSQAPPSKGVMVDNAVGKLGNPSGESSSTSSSTHREDGQKGNSVNHQPRNSFRRGNNGPHLRGNGSGSYGGGRRDHDRGNQDWNQPRNFVGRDVHMQPQRGPSRPPIVRGPPHVNPLPLIPPSNPMWPLYNAHMMYPEAQVYYVPDPFRAMPVITPMPPLYVPFQDHELLMKIVKQINYYFSDENLVKDIHLRTKMDDQGWVPITTVAKFNKVVELTDDIQLILYALQSSNVVEVEVNKLRRRNDWNRWILPPIQIQYASIPNVFRAQLQGFTGQAQ